MPPLQNLSRPVAVAGHASQQMRLLPWVPPCQNKTNHPVYGLVTDAFLSAPSQFIAAFSAKVSWLWFATLIAPSRPPFSIRFSPSSRADGLQTKGMRFTAARQIHRRGKKCGSAPNISKTWTARPCLACSRICR